ncbi:MAG: hypothetical protein FJZ01_26380 [Candidatus Sericytochromatia bacterium]|nr:hypothetical protein [Candidatus Tanganyikabacteria bacterium]
MPRPVIYVIAGVNGAGKSSIGGRHLLDQAGVSWFNPDDFARELIATLGLNQAAANAEAWQESVRRLDEAVARGEDFAFETTLGGDTITARLLAATSSHDVVVWFCGLAAPDLHIERVKLRVAHGGHDIPEATIRARCSSSLGHLIELMPRLSYLRVYDNSVSVAPGEALPDPVLVLELQGAQILFPCDAASLQATPGWAKPLVEAALGMQEPV